MSELLEALELTIRDLRESNRLNGEERVVPVSNQKATELVQRFGTLQAAERHYGVELDVWGRFFTTAHLREVRDRVNARLAMSWRVP